MALKANATMTFVGYEVKNNEILLRFMCANPGAGEPNDYLISIAQAELDTVVDATTFSNLIKTKLERIYRAKGIADKLDVFIGRDITI